MENYGHKHVGKFSINKGVTLAPNAVRHKRIDSSTFPDMSRRDIWHGGSPVLSVQSIKCG
jgi:hypothetical protein